MFTLIRITHRRPNGTASEPYHAAVDFTTGAVIPFDTEKCAEESVREFNSGDASPDGYYLWPMSECVNAETGAQLQPATIDAPVPAEPELAVLNILGLDYAVPHPVAEYVAELKKGFTAAVDKVHELEDAYCHRCMEDCHCK